MLARDPLGGVLMAALGTRFVIAGMISELEVAIVAAIGFTAEGRGATGQNGLDGALVRRKDLLPKAPLVRWPVLGQDLGQFDHRGGIV